MKSSTVDRITMIFTYVFGFLLVALCILLGWAIVEIILWITSK